jgi:hypothetical protein
MSFVFTNIGPIRTSLFLTISNILLGLEEENRSRDPNHTLWRRETQGPRVFSLLSAIRSPERSKWGQIEVDFELIRMFADEKHMSEKRDEQRLA